MGQTKKIIIWEFQKQNLNLLIISRIFPIMKSCFKLKNNILHLYKHVHTAIGMFYWFPFPFPKWPFGNIKKAFFSALFLPFSMPGKSLSSLNYVLVEVEVITVMFCEGLYRRKWKVLLICGRHYLNKSCSFSKLSFSSFS